ncbi:hypothetical protein [Anaerosporobacter faecicola]|uniref:hypothetical protein n=1 Tax=Anaerosporobacter faecicola TaxID=2718714 RepID=UPI00143882B3|nr:hypothetical protein [Anaerosporobacter faecicola]
MGEQFDEGGMKYCPSCRNILEYHGSGRYECLLCCTHVVVLDKDPDIYYEIPFTQEEREAYYLARKEGIRNRVFFEREREREVKKKEAVQNERFGVQPIENKNEVFRSFMTMTQDTDEPVKTEQEEKQEEKHEEVSPYRKCTICGKAIKSGSYCKECTFEQIKKMQRKDLMHGRSTDNYGNMRYKGYRD